MTRFHLLLVVLLLPRLALADEGLAILELRFTALPPAVQSEVRSSVEQAMAAAGYSVIDEQRAAGRLRQAGVPAGCTVGPCLQQVGRALEVRRAVVGGVSGQGTSYDITLTMLETGGGTVLAQINERCDVCNFKEVEGAAARAAEKLHGQTLVFLSTRATLVVHSDPPAADALLDGLPVGKTPLQRILTPGRHILEVAAEGYQAVKRRLDLVAGKTDQVRIRLVSKLQKSIVGDGQRSELAPTPGWVKWAVLGSGVLFGGIGGGLLALDGREKADVRYVHDTRTAGATMVSLGAAAAVAATLITVVQHLGNGRDR